MARKSKPPGKEKWTWDEIRIGRKLDRTQRFHLKMARALEEAKDENGRIKQPEGNEVVKLWGFYVAFLLIMVVIGLIQLVIYLSK